MSDSRAPSLPSHLAERAGIDRRRFLQAAGGAAGALFLAACDSMGPASAAGLLKFAEPMIRRTAQQELRADFERLKDRLEAGGYPPQAAPVD